jgi:hypothetical protein
MRDLFASTTLHYITLTSLHFTPTGLMLRSCITCRAVASPDIQLYYCAQCQSAVYCSKACMKIDWRKQQRFSDIVWRDSSNRSHYGLLLVRGKSVDDEVATSRKYFGDGSFRTCWGFGDEATLSPPPPPRNPSSFRRIGL